jgi:serine/threonine protein kinase
MHTRTSATSPGADPTTTTRADAGRAIIVAPPRAGRGPMSETKKWPWDKPSRDSGPATHDARRAATEPQIFAYCRDLGVSPKVSPGMDPSSPALDADGDGRYAIGRELGRGGGGVVYLGTDRSLRRSVAVKVLSPDLVTDPMRVQAFVEEAVITGGLEHPNIVPAYDLGCSSTLGIYYTMKRLTGRPLSQVLTALRRGDPATVQSFGMYRLLGGFIELCRAVAYAHSRGVIHCDIKPENVFIGEYGEVVLVDWGLAQVLGPDGKHQARARMHAGTPEYMAPEQITKSGHDLDPRSDVWALGVMLYELLTLTVPFQGANAKEVLMRVMVEQLEPPSTRAPGRPIPPGVEDICRRSLSKNREFRYGSVAELLAELEAELEGTRERVRRAEQARRSIDAVEALLARMHPIEAEVDRMLAATATLAGHDLRLSELRRALLEGYREAADHALRGCEADGDTVSDRVGDLYWRIFLRIYPSSAPISDAGRELANDLLLRLSEKAFSAVVRAGRKLTRTQAGGTLTPSDPPAKGQYDDPWLHIVSALCGDEDEAIDPDHAPSGLRQLITRISFLQRISLFQAVPACSLLPIAEACQEYGFRQHQPIFLQGDVGDTLCILLRGRVEVIRDGAVINHLGPGDVCGEVAVLGAATRTAGVIATEPVKALMLGADRFRRIVRENGDIGLAVIQVLSERLRVATERESALRSLTTTILGHRRAPATDADDES